MTLVEEDDKELPCFSSFDFTLFKISPKEPEDDLPSEPIEPFQVDDAAIPQTEVDEHTLKEQSAIEQRPAPVQSEPKPEPKAELPKPKPVVAPAKSTAPKPTMPQKPVAPPVKPTTPPQTASKPAKLAEPPKEAPKPIEPEEPQTYLVTPTGDTVATSVQSNSSLEPSFVVIGLPDNIARITLEGAGWILLSPIDAKVRFLKREFSPTEQSIFSFKPVEAGEFKLQFSRRTPRGQEICVVLLKVMPVGQQSAVTNLDPPLQSSSVGPQKNQPIAPLPDLPTSPQNTEIKELKTQFDSLKTDPSTHAEAIRIGEEFVRRFRSYSQTAEVLYYLGQIFEQAGPYVNRKKAYNYYLDAYKNYPTSPYSKRSKERMTYLEQFYLRLP